MQTLKKDNKMYAYHVKDELGDYIKDDERYTINTAKEVYAPDSADLSMWMEVDTQEDYVQKYMEGFEFKPLSEDEKKAMIDAKIEAEQKNK